MEKPNTNPMNIDPQTQRYMLFERAIDRSGSLMELGLIQEKVEHARELLYSHCFYTDEH
jgi:hypothetical protein